MASCDITLHVRKQLLQVSTWDLRTDFTSEQICNLLVLYISTNYFKCIEGLYRQKLFQLMAPVGAKISLEEEEIRR